MGIFKRSLLPEIPGDNYNKIFKKITAKYDEQMGDSCCDHIYYNADIH